MPVIGLVVEIVVDGAKMAKRTDFCRPDCSCARAGEVRCLKLLPEIHEWNGKKIDETNYGALVDALNKMWSQRGQ